MSNPNVYGYCEAGCRRRVPTYEEHMALASYNSPLVCYYNLEPNTTIDQINDSYTDALNKDCFNRTPIVGEKFHCFGRTQTDRMTFHLTAEVTGEVNEHGNVPFKAVAGEVMTTGPLLPLYTVSLQYDGANGTDDVRPLDDITEGLTFGWYYEYFNRAPLVGEKFQGFGHAADGHFHYTAEITELLEDGARCKILQYGLDKVDYVKEAGYAATAGRADNAIYAESARYASRATNAANDGSGHQIESTYINRNYVVQKVTNPNVESASTTRKYNDENQQKIAVGLLSDKAVTDVLGISGVLNVTNPWGDNIDIHFDGLFTADREYIENGETIKLRCMEKGLSWAFPDRTIGGRRKFHNLHLIVEVDKLYVYIELYVDKDTTENLVSCTVNSVPQINVFYK